MISINWVLPKKLAGSRYPEPFELPEIYNAGIRAIVSLERYEDPKIITQNNFEHLHLPIPDFTAPTLEQLKQMIKFISSKLEQTKPVLVHCYAGIGRTGTVLAGYLVYLGMDAESALRKIRSRIPGAVQTYDQEEIVKIYAQDGSKRGT